MKYTKNEQEQALETLKKIKRGDTLYTVLRSCSRSGMKREISVVWFRKKNEPWHISWSVSAILEQPFTKSGDTAVVVHGCGMDMGFDLVYRLSQELFGDGYALKQVWL